MQSGYTTTQQSYGGQQMPQQSTQNLGAPFVLRIVEARGLKKSDLSGKTDPYCIIKFKKGFVGSLLHHEPKLMTRVVERNLNPIWNEEFILHPHNPDLDIIQIQVYDKDRIGADTFLGKVNLPVAQYWKRGLIDEWIPLSSKRKLNKPVFGEIHLLVSFNDTGLGYHGGQMGMGQQSLYGQPGYGSSGMVGSSGLGSSGYGQSGFQQSGLSSGYGSSGLVGGPGYGSSGLSSGYGQSGLSSGYGSSNLGQTGLSSGYGSSLGHGTTTSGLGSGVGQRDIHSSSSGLGQNVVSTGTTTSGLSSGYGQPGLSSGYGSSNLGQSGISSGYGSSGLVGSKDYGYGQSGLSSGYGSSGLGQSGIGSSGMMPGYGSSNLGSSFGMGGGFVNYPPPVARHQDRF